MSVQLSNITLAEQLSTLADLSEMEGANKYKINAYRKAAKTISGMGTPISSVKDLQGLPGIGKSIAKMVEEFLEYKVILDLAVLRDKYPPEALTMTQVSGVGPKRAYKFYNEGIHNLQELIEACEAGKISNQNIVKGAMLAKHYQGRTPITRAYVAIASLLDDIRNQSEVDRADFAGSVRRGKETIKDVDLLVVSNDQNATIEKFLTYGEELVRGEEKARIILPLTSTHTIQVDILFATKDDWGSKLAYFTGSVEHNVAMRKRAISLGYKLNEHGLWSGNTRVAGETEESIYQVLGIPYCPPELREGNELLDEVPEIISFDDITTDWHTHSTYSSDAKGTIDQMVAAAAARGLKSIGITDHVEAMFKWDPLTVGDRIKECYKASKKYGIMVYPSAEVGIRPDGSLEDRIDLNIHDYLVASIHHSLKKNTVSRIIKAIGENSKIKIIGHPTTRIIGRRDVPDDDWDLLFKTCSEKNIALEINGARGDLSVDYIKRAKELGCKFTLSSDAHDVNQLSLIDIAIRFARRAGLTKKDLVKPF